MPKHRAGDTLRRHSSRCRVAILFLSGLFVVAPAPSALAQNVPVARSVANHRFADHIAEASRRFRIPQAWIRAVLDAESAQDIGAVSSAGAMGLMQIMPDTWDELRALHRLGDDPFDPRDNIFAGTAYLRAMLDRYGNVGAMLAAYNAGPGRYDEYLSTGRPLPAETRDYVAKLAPLLGANPLPERTETTPRPTDWRGAPLFVVPAGGASPAGSLQLDGHADAEATAEPRHGDDAMPLYRPTASSSPDPAGIHSHEHRAALSRRGEPLRSMECLQMDTHGSNRGWQDKGARGALRLGGYISRACATFLRCAPLAPASRDRHLISAFSSLARCVEVRR
jgi:hypothetical protein